LDLSFFGGLTDEVRGPQWAAVCGLALNSMRGQMRGDARGQRSSARKVADWFGSFRDKFR
jgi:hypothetical protein